MTEEDLNSVLIACLIHDIGYYSMAHDVEEADPTLANYEKLGQELLNRNVAGLGSNIRDVWGIDLKRVNDILNADPETLKGDLKPRILHSLIKWTFRCR